jgi:hypothetical protein
MRTPVLKAPVFTGRAHGFAIQQHEDRVVAHGGRRHHHHRLAAAPLAARGFSSERNATLAFISGRRWRPAWFHLHLDLHGGLLAVGLGRDLLDEAVVLAVGKGVGGDGSVLAGVQLGEIVLADVQLHFQVVQIGQRDHVALWRRGRPRSWW